MPILYSLNRNTEMALEISGNIILVGDRNEDLLNDNGHTFKYVMLMNCSRNAITLHTRNAALLDSVIVSDEMIVLDSGINVSQNKFLITLQLLFATTCLPLINCLVYIKDLILMYLIIESYLRTGIVPTMITYMVHVILYR